MKDTSILTLRDKTILFAEDDELVREKTVKTLTILFKRVIAAKDGREALEMYEDEHPDIVFSDVKMPEMDGLMLASKIRQTDLDTPIIFFTAYNEQRYLLKALNLPVDGYLLKPANLDEMISAFSKCIKRAAKGEIPLVDFGNGVMYSFDTRELYQNGAKVMLGIKEESLLRLLIQNHPKILTKEQASAEVWPMESIVPTSIKNVVARLRNKIGSDHIVAITGVGWKLVL